MSELPRITDISRPAAMRLRITTLLAGIHSTIRSSPGSPSRIIFIHIPKTGGVTVEQYLACCLGGKRGRQRCKLNEIYINQPPNDREIDSARASRFVFGHFSWASVERIGLRKDDYIFTFLREPRRRLYSAYRFMVNYPEDRLLDSAKKSRIERCRGITQLDMFTTKDLDLRCTIDNYMVRQLSGRLTDYPLQESQWPVLLEAAKRNLRSLNFVGFQETYEVDFKTVLHQLNMPCLSAIPRKNAIDEIIKRAGRDSTVHREDPSEVAAAMTPLVRWDEQLYEYACQLRSTEMH